MEIFSNCNSFSSFIRDSCELKNINKLYKYEKHEMEKNVEFLSSVGPELFLCIFITFHLCAITFSLRVLLQIRIQQLQLPSVSWIFLNCIFRIISMYRAIWSNLTAYKRNKNYLKISCWIKSRASEIRTCDGKSLHIKKKSRITLLRTIVSIEIYCAQLIGMWVIE